MISRVIKGHKGHLKFSKSSFLRLFFVQHPIFFKLWWKFECFTYIIAYSTASEYLLFHLSNVTALSHVNTLLKVARKLIPLFDEPNLVSPWVFSSKAMCFFLEKMIKDSGISFGRDAFSKSVHTPYLKVLKMTHKKN